MGICLQVASLFCLFAASLFAQFSFPAANYFVDGARGSDSNSGTGIGHEFATIAKLQSVIATGQTGAVSGGYAGCFSAMAYREQLTLTATAIAIAGYGCAPLFDASDPIPSGAWSQPRGAGTCYQATITTANVLGFIRYWQGNISFPRASSLPNCDATASTYWVSGDPVGNGTVSFTLSVHTADSSSPGTGGEFNARGYGIFSPYAATVSSVSTRRNLANNGSFELGQASYVYNVAANDGTKHNMFMQGGSTYSHVTATDSYYAGQSKIAFILFDATVPNSALDANFINAAYIETLEQTGTGFDSHTSDATIYNTVRMVNCSTTGDASSFGFAARSMQVTGGTFGGSATVGNSVALLQGLTITGQIQITASPGTIEIDSITSSGFFINGNIRIGTGPAVVPSVSVHDSSFSNSRAFDGSIYLSSGATPALFTSLRNTFAAPVQTNHYVGPGAATLNNANSSYGNNTYHYPSGQSSWLLRGGTTYDISSNTPWNNWLAIEPTATRVTP